MTYPSIAGANNIIKIIEQLRNNFPPNIDVKTIKKYSIAPKAEKPIVNMLMFLKLIDDDGNRISENRNIFLKNDTAFQLGFTKIIKDAYDKLFELHGDTTWNLDDEILLAFFKEEVGGALGGGLYRVKTFRVLAELAGKRDARSKTTVQVKSPAPTKTNKPKQDMPKSNTPKSAPFTIPTEQAHLKPSGNFALSVRIEVNLPSDGTKETYDNIFKSIRENLINE